jgi:hypothetical protein
MSGDRKVRTTEAAADYIREKIPPRSSNTFGVISGAGMT